MTVDVGGVGPDRRIYRAGREPDGDEAGCDGSIVSSEGGSGEEGVGGSGGDETVGGSGADTVGGGVVGGGTSTFGTCDSSSSTSLSKT